MTIKKHHRQWLQAIEASYTGKPISFDYLGITPRRLESLERLGLIEYTNGGYRLTDKGKLEARKP